MCPFGGVVYRWKGYDFVASKLVTKCSDCVKAVQNG
jgi:hypothetical protein